jgi:hypothetical protein
MVRLSSGIVHPQEDAHQSGRVSWGWQQRRCRLAMLKGEAIMESDPSVYLCLRFGRPEPKSERRCPTIFTLAAAWKNLVGWRLGHEFAKVR